MDHKRKTIREKIVTLLKAGATSAGDNVFSNRAHALFATELPSIIVYSGDEDSEFLNPPENRLKRTLDVFIELAIGQTTNIEDEIDALCLEVEEIIKPKSELDRLYGNLVQSVELKKTETGIFEKADKVIGSAKLTYSFEYETNY